MKTPTLLSYEGPVCVRCAHRHRAGGLCASHVWGDECEYTATETCPTTTRPPLPTPARALVFCDQKIDVGNSLMFAQCILLPEPPVTCPLHPAGWWCHVCTPPARNLT